VKRQLLLASWSLFLLGLTFAIGLEKPITSPLWGGKIYRAFRGFQERLTQNLSPRSYLWIIISLTLWVRLIPIWIQPASSNYDIESFHLVGINVLQLSDIYSSPTTADRHPYLPFQVYWSTLSTWLANHSPLPFETIVRIEPILADALIAGLIFSILSKSNKKDLAFKVALLFALSPISVMTSAYHGQFDSLPILMLILSLWIAESKASPSGFFLGLGILFKSWPVLALPSLFTFFPNQRAKLKFLAWTLFTPILGTTIYCIVFQVNFINVAQHALSYNHGTGIWGYTYLLRVAAIIAPFFASPVNFIFDNARIITLALLGCSWWILARKENLWRAGLTILTAFLGFTHAFSIQYLSWIIPLILINLELKWFLRYSLACFSYMFLVYNTLIMTFSITNIMSWPKADLFIIIPASLPVWIVLLIYIFDRFKQSIFLRGNNFYENEITLD
jgi:hypothetical protein